MFDDVLTFAKVVASSVSDKARFTLYNLIGIDGEESTAQEVYQALGIIGRPRPPETDAHGNERSLEAVAARTSDGTAPFGYRDERLHANFPNPKDGTIAFVGYGGAFLAFDDTADPSGSKKATIATLYVPYDFDSDGIPQKAHVLTFDPSNAGAEAITLAHGEGFAISMVPGEGIVFRADAGTFARIKPGEVLVHAPKIMLKGNVGLGAQPDAGLPLAVGGTPSPSVFVSPV